MNHMRVARGMRAGGVPAILAWGAMALWAPPSRAQTPPPVQAAAPAAGQLEEVTVTARKRTEDVQQISDPLTVITSDEIEHADVQNIQDVARLTPNLVIYDQLVPGIQNVSFRGFTTVQGGQSPFTVIVDGVQEPGQEFLKQQLVDVNQVEILRGPQGTLYGAGAIAGAINITTKQPGNDYEGMVKLGFFEGNTYEGTATISGPIVEDKAFFRASAYGITEDGLIPNPAAKHNADFQRDHTLQGEALFKPMDDLDIDLRAHWLHGYDGALWLVPVSDADFPNVAPNPDENTDNTFKRDLQTYSLKADYRLPWFTVTSITGYNQSDWYAYADGDFSAANIATQDWIHNTSSKSEELRLTSPDDGRLRWNAGFFWQQSDVQDLTDFFVGGFDFTSYDHYTSNAWALFGQATYDVTDQFQVTGGFRYDEDDQKAVDLQTAELTKRTFTEPQPKVTLTYKWTPQLLNYFTYSKGFRTGGFNPNSPLAVRVYDNETSENFEGGIKSEWLDNRLIVNGAVFHTDFNNQQFFFSEATSTGIFRVITNIPATEVNGVEIEIDAKPIPYLTIQASLGYNDTSIEQFPGAVADIGNRTPQVYGLTSDLSFDYTYPITDQYAVIGHFDWERRGDVYWDLANTLETPPRNFLNTRISLELDDRYSIAFVGRNLTSERTPSAVGANALGSSTTLASYNEPRQLGVELQARF